MDSKRGIPARRPSWRQATPEDQLVAVLNGARGYLSNIEAGVYKDPADIQEAARKADDLLEQAVELSALVKGHWRFTLVAIDAQVRALRVGDHSEALRNGASLIRAARRLNQPVLLLRIKTPWPDNPVTPELLREIEQPSKYERGVEIEKTGCGGGEEIRTACRHHGFPSGKLILFGFWLKGCVLATARQLSLSLPESEIIVVSDACNAEPTEYRSLFDDLPNVRLLTARELGLPLTD